MSFTVGIMIGLGLITFIFGYISINMVNEHRFVRMFFLILCLISMTATLHVMTIVADDEGSTAIHTFLDEMVTIMISINTLIILLFTIQCILTGINILRQQKNMEDDYEEYDEEDRKMMM